MDKPHKAEVVYIVKGRRGQRLRYLAHALQLDILNT